jgi:competence protein ComEA
MRRPIVRSLTVLLSALMLLLATAPGFAAGQPVNLNTASAADLEALNGIGPAKAQAIVEYREKNGAFKNVEDLKMVRGIGDKLLEQLRPQVTVGEGQKSDSSQSAKR